MQTAEPFIRDPSESDSDPLNWTGEFTVTAEEVAEFGSPEWLIKNLIIRHHIVVLAADPGAGKTTICTNIAGELVKAGCRVVYVLADIGQSGVKHYHDMAEANGWDLLLPDIKVGQSMDSVVDRLVEMNATGDNFDGVVMLFDTLKKMVDVINKRSAKAIFQLFRSLTAKGLTIVLLAHTNKYTGEDGEPIFEGTHDIKTDSDDLIYLIPMKRDDGVIVASTKPSNKVRGAFEPITFEIGKDRSVVQLDNYIDTAAEVKAKHQLEADAVEIDAILDAIKAGNHKQSEIISYCKEQKISSRKVRRILPQYSQHCQIKMWYCTKGMNNAWLYYLPNQGNGSDAKI